MTCRDYKREIFMSANVKFRTRQRLLAAATLAGVVAVASISGAATAYSVTPPTTVPTTYTDSSPITPPSNLTPGLTANLWTISPTTNLVQYGPGNLEGGPNTSGYPNLQGMANLEALAQNGTISVESNGMPGSAVGSATYNATPYFSFTDSAINTNKIVAIGGGGATIATVLSGAGNNLATDLVSGISLPASASTNTWNNVIFDQAGYVYVSQANSSYTFALASNDLNDDGTEVLLGGTGQVGSGKVVAFQNASDIESTNGVATLVGGNTYAAAVDTVTFTQAGYYPIEIFNAQTFGGAFENVSFAPVNNAPALSFYTTPEPAPMALMGTSLGGLAVFGLRKRRMA
jgi:hypothetical protein